MKAILILTFCLTLTLKAHGQQDSTREHRIDKQAEKCIEEIIKTKGIVTTVDMADCAHKTYKAWDKELNKYYQLLMKILKPDEKERLKIAQRKWISYRDSELNFSGALYSNLQGTMYVVFSAGRAKEITKQRTLELKDYYDTLTDSGQIGKSKKTN